MFMLLLVVILNLGISFWNARAAGQVWAESKGVGGWIRVIAWCAVIQATVGFTSSYAILLGFGMNELGYLPAKYFKLMMSMTYLLIIIPALGSGLIITIHSWIQLAREKSLANLGTTGWNTFAQAYNTYNAINGIGSAFGDVVDGLGGLFSSKDDEDSNGMAVLAIGLVILAALAGVATTYAIVKSYAGTLPVPESVERRKLAYR